MSFNRKNESQFNFFVDCIARLKLDELQIVAKCWGINTSFMNKQKKVAVLRDDLTNMLWGKESGEEESEEEEPVQVPKQVQKQNSTRGSSSTMTAIVDDPFADEPFDL